jgi:hypothetical protein
MPAARRDDSTTSQAVLHFTALQFVQTADSVRLEPGPYRVRPRYEAIQRTGDWGNSPIVGFRENLASRTRKLSEGSVYQRAAYTNAQNHYTFSQVEKSLATDQGRVFSIGVRKDLRNSSRCFSYTARGSTWSLLQIAAARPTHSPVGITTLVICHL